MLCRVLVSSVLVCLASGVCGTGGVCRADRCNPSVRTRELVIEGSEVEILTDRSVTPPISPSWPVGGWAVPAGNRRSSAARHACLLHVCLHVCCLRMVSMFFCRIVWENSVSAVVHHQSAGLDWT